MKVQQFLAEDRCDVRIQVTLKSGESFLLRQDGVSYGEALALTGLRDDKYVFVPVDDVDEIQILS